MSKRRVYKKERNKKKNKKRIIITTLVLGFAIALYSGYVFFEAYQAASKTYDDLDREKSDLREEKVEIKDEPFSVLLMGIEDYQSGGAQGRADTLILATFNPDTKTAKLVSIPRDTRVEIPGRPTPEKINHAYFYGEEKLTIETVENFLNVPVDHYATVNFEGFKNIVDIVGGITVNVPFDFQQNSDDRVAEKLQFYEGEMQLDGRYALAYARMRLEDPRGDIGRNERQREVIGALVDKIVSPATLLKVSDIADNIAANVQTDVKMSNGISFLMNYSDFRSSNIENITFEHSFANIDGLDYVIIEDEAVEEVSRELRVHLELESESHTAQQDQSSEANAGIETQQDTIEGPSN